MKKNTSTIVSTIKCERRNVCFANYNYYWKRFIANHLTGIDGYRKEHSSPWKIQVKNVFWKILTFTGWLSRFEVVLGQTSRTWSRIRKKINNLVGWYKDYELLKRFYSQYRLHGQISGLEKPDHISRVTTYTEQYFAI